jgi:NDP-sugar pyrophosphorylase family protein
MTVIITMAGHGQRFLNSGYKVPKYKIFARNKSLFEWSISSLELFYDHNFIFACLDDIDQKWISDILERKGIKDYKFILRKAVSKGQAETAFDSMTSLHSEKPVWIYNIDTYISDSALNPNLLMDSLACIPVFHSSQKNMSYVKFDSNGMVEDIKEKSSISEWASLGLYGFASAKLYRDLYCSFYKGQNSNVSVAGEEYIAPLFSLLLAQDMKISAPFIDSKSVHILGTPNDVLKFDPIATPPFGNFG